MATYQVTNEQFEALFDEWFALSDKGDNYQSWLAGEVLRLRALLSGRSTVKPLSALPPEIQIIEDQLAEDRRQYGNAFYTMKDGRKVRIPPQELYIDTAEPAHK